MTKSDLDSLLKKQRREAEERDAKRRAESLGLDYINLVSVGTPTEIKALQLIKRSEAEEGKVVPVQIVGKKMILAVYDPNNPKTKEVISKLEEKYEVTVAVTSISGLNHAWEHYDYVKQEDLKDITGKVSIDPERIKSLEESIKNLEDFSKLTDNLKDIGTSEIMEMILAGGMSLGASDIHIEPTKKDTTLRLRVDGLLHTVTENIPSDLYKSVITRIKLLSRLKLNIKDEPQDGRFTIGVSGKDVEIRTSIIPSEYGETAVLRILDPKALSIKLEELGWREDDLKIVQKEIEKPNGLILNTGPTGSGKTTTLYAFLKRLTKPEIKVITVENPIEYHLEGISQTQVDKSANYTFASGLRSILRQDPDVILVGEIRDEETAGIALNASLTGHMVFSTLHTNDAVGAIPRLFDLGAKENILGPALTLIIAQRLVRRLCEECKKEKEISEKEKESIDQFINSLPERVNKDEYKDYKIFEATGCKKCNDLGYKGRTSIFEVFQVTEKIQELIYKNPTEIDLKRATKEQGMTSMQEDGVLKILKGITSFEEIERLTGEIKNPSKDL
ncbi:MAG: GspE/PulE family protein [Candidatus Paceibacterota bacterium]